MRKKISGEDLEEVLAAQLAVETEDANQSSSMGFMARAFIQATLPHRAVQGRQFLRANGNFTLTITAIGKYGLPFGSIPRLFLSWITTEAVRTRSPVLQLGPTLSGFLSELGLPRTGGELGGITRFRDQAKRLFNSAISCSYTSNNSDHGLGFTIARRYSLWWDHKSTEQIPLWKSHVTLNQDFFQEIIERPVPLDLNALRALKRSPLALDIYSWLTYRLFSLRKSQTIPWPLLQLQFGADYAPTPQGGRDFKRSFLKQLKHVHAVYPDAKVSSEPEGLRLKLSPTHKPRVGGSRRKALTETPPRKEKEKTPMIKPAHAPFCFDPLLDSETYIKAREVSPGLDIYALEDAWKEWVTQTGSPPKSPDQAFIGFCKKKAAQQRRVRLESSSEMD